MGKRLNIGLDVDGVISAFVPAARKLCKQLFNGRPDDALVQTSWAFDSLGITPEEENKLWRRIDAIPNWWLDHKPMENTDLLPQLCEKHRVIFITNRKDGTGWPIEDQTKVWLKRNFGLNNTNVIISDKKGPVAAGLKLDYFIDDRPKNCIEVHQEGCTKIYMLDATYNQDCGVWVIPRVKSLNDFIRMILEDSACQQS